MTVAARAEVLGAAGAVPTRYHGTGGSRARPARPGGDAPTRPGADARREIPSYTRRASVAASPERSSTVRRLILLSLLLCVLGTPSHGQPAGAEPAQDDPSLRKLLLLGDLQALESKSAKLDGPLARALAKAEIADAAWALDEAWARKLLTEAYQLTFPEDEERARLRDRPVGAPPILPSPVGRARWAVRTRVLNVAGRDKTFAAKLLQLGVEQLGPYEGVMRSAQLADAALEAGDSAEAVRYILQSIDADPTQISWEPAITELAARDRAAADKLILQYLDRLGSVPLSSRNGSFARVHFLLSRLIFAADFAPRPGGRRVAEPGPAVMRAYVAYMLRSLPQLEQREPGALRSSRILVVSVWTLLRKHAPELAGEFMELDKLSRSPGDNSPLPQQSMAEISRAQYEERAGRNSSGDQPDPQAVESLISAGDFARARKLIDKFEDGWQKTRLAEEANAAEALSLARKGDLAGAQTLAEQLKKAASILRVYPAIVAQCAAGKDQACASNSVYQAMRQLKRADASPPVPPEGIPSSVMASASEFDPVTSSLGRLAVLLAPVNETLALEVLDELVAASNASKVETGQGRVGFDPAVFKTIAAGNEARARQAAENFKDPLRQIVAAAAIYQRKTKELAPKGAPGK